MLCFRFGCEKSEAMALELFLRAADLSCVELHLEDVCLLQDPADKVKLMPCREWNCLQRKAKCVKDCSLLAINSPACGWCDAARDACVAWILVAKKIGVVKDVRKVIAKMVCETQV